MNGPDIGAEFARVLAEHRQQRELFRRAVQQALRGICRQVAREVVQLYMAATPSHAEHRRHARSSRRRRKIANRKLRHGIRARRVVVSGSTIKPIALEVVE